MHRIPTLLALAAVPLLALGACRMDRHTSDDRYDRDSFMSQAERRLETYQNNWERLLASAGDEAGEYGDDWEDLIRGTGGNLQRADRDLRRLGQSSEGNWERYQNQWEDLMDQIADGLNEAWDRVQ